MFPPPKQNWIYDGDDDDHDNVHDHDQYDDDVEKNWFVIIMIILIRTMVGKDNNVNDYEAKTNRFIFEQKSLLF